LTGKRPDNPAACRNETERQKAQQQDYGWKIENLLFEIRWKNTKREVLRKMGFIGWKPADNP